MLVATYLVPLQWRCLPLLHLEGFSLNFPFTPAKNRQGGFCNFRKDSSAGFSQSINLNPKGPSYTPFLRRTTTNPNPQVSPTSICRSKGSPQPLAQAVV